MTRTGLNDLISLLNDRRLCLPAFDIAGGQVDFLSGVLAACENARSPALLLVYAPAETYGDLKTCAAVVRALTARASLPVVLHLDHGRDEQAVVEALAAGFDSVMFDGSDLPLDENIRRTKDLAERAHAQGAAIEGEVGRIGAEQEDGPGTHALTDPDEAARFVRETGVDVLAPAVGNAHGFYKAPPRLQFDLVERIAAAAGVPLSLHGGTGIPLEDVRRAGELGMRKMNVATGLHKAFADALRQAATAEERFSWRAGMKAASAAVTEMAGDYLRRLGLEGLV